MDHQLCLSCKNHQATLVGVFKNLLEIGSLADCTVAAEGKYIKALKLVRDSVPTLRTTNTPSEWSRTSGTRNFAP
ncbi:longitudinals lacking protein, isoforms H/M/V-like isoform X2 [Drosophila subpulchrella]|uniref:longitudinals lacking protein, isoforms H/M/V-like isoform X2 n=1 Tax=Drosophila subpulchrella TaxID=1486046 RepID=UPI0018A149F6|nr:longitudinals lacking protein, isoforms H/M/V-like isoform X2 [Drosophila subpulchrella]